MATRYIDEVSSLSDIQSLPGSAGIGVLSGVPYVRSAAGGLSALDLSKLPAPPYFVDAANGSNSYDGLSWNKPYLTMAKALSVVSSGGLIIGKGSFREQASTPAGVFDVTIIGAGNRPRHADAHTTNGGYSTMDWRAPSSPTAATPLLKIRQQGWRVQNILFVGDVDDTVGAIQLFRDGGSGDDERDASHAEILGCRFAAGYFGIEDSGGCANVKVAGCTFQQFATSGEIGMKSVVGAGIGTLWGWEIARNRFLANHTDIDMGLTNAIIEWNHFMLTALGTTNTVALLLTDGSNNWISRNYMHAASNHNGVNARFVPGTGDMFGGNYWSDVEEYAEPAS